MALSIVSNQAASIATRSLEQSNNAATATAEKLSSGKRINSAKDDAAGSAIAARLSAEVAGLQQAGVNAGQASSMLQIADGAFQNVEDILTRAKSLSVQAGSEQISDQERAFLDQEFQALKGEIDRIASDTEFNGTKLVAGQNNGQTDLANLAATNLNGAMGDIIATMVGTTMRTADGAASYNDVSFDNTDIAAGINGINVDGLNLAASITAAQTNAGAETFKLQSAGQIGNLTFATGSNTLQLMANVIDGSATRMVTLSAFIPAGDVDAGMNLVASNSYTLASSDGLTAMISLGTSFSTSAGFTAADNNDIFLQAGGNTNFTFKVGTGTDSTADEISVAVGSVSQNALGLNGQSIDTKANADLASDAVSGAIDTLQAKRSDVGAAQNRLDFAAQNVELTRENQEAARSELEDLNVAKAITEFSQQQLLVQAGTSTLSQANQLPQNLLQLFR